MAELAEDIRENGLIHPIVLDADGQLVDGRNRLAACKLAKIEPRFEKMDGIEPAAYIAAANLKRRNLTKGQQAMATAKIYPAPEKGGRGKKSQNTKETLGFSIMRLSQARFVLQHAPDLADSVLKGVKSLDDAEKDTRQRLAQNESIDTKMARLRAEAPDLAERVENENITLEEAIALLEERQRRLREIREAGRSAADHLSEFSGRVIAINSAIEANEQIILRPGTLKLIDSAHQRLHQLFEEGGLRERKT